MTERPAKASSTKQQVDSRPPQSQQSQNEAGNGRPPRERPQSYYHDATRSNQYDSQTSINSYGSMKRDG